MRVVCKGNSFCLQYNRHEKQSHTENKRICGHRYAVMLRHSIADKGANDDFKPH